MVDSHFPSLLAFRLVNLQSQDVGVCRSLNDSISLRGSAASCSGSPKGLRPLSDDNLDMEQPDSNLVLVKG